MNDKGVMELAKDQSGHGMKTKLVLTITYDNEMNLKYKVRLVGCGYSQIKFRDYDETYAPTVTSQHILYYCTYYSVSHTCTVRPMFPVLLITTDYSSLL